MRKRPRVVKEECTLAQEEEGERVCVSVQPSSCHLALVQAENHLLREEIGRLQVQRSELEKQKRNLEVEKVSLRAQNKQLVAENTLLVRSLQESEDMVKRLNNEMFLLRFGTEIVSSQLEVASER